MSGSTKLVIVESPTKAKKIGGYLGKDYQVMASVGHIRDLAQPSQIPAASKEQYGRFGVDVNNGFAPYYIIGEGKKSTVAELKRALKNADELYLATDEDREGEAIAWHLVQTLKPKVPVKRMVFHEITPAAIKRSLEHTRDVDAHMVDAQETRRVLDRLYGYELSPVLWRKVGPGLSAGRVQSVATRLIVERERERMAFVRAQYWDVVARVLAANSDSEVFNARLVSLDERRVAGSKDFDSSGKLTAAAVDDRVKVIDQETANALADAVAGSDFVVQSLDTKPYRRRPQSPFTTSTLQQAAGNRLGMGSRATMRAAQILYENGYITYMRTDSVTLSQEAIQAARAEVTERFGKQYLSAEPKQYVTTSAGAQEAHEAIRPAGASFKSPEELASVLPPDQLRLYTLIWQRTLASQMADATGSTATVRLSADAGNLGTAIFQASGTVITFPGFLAVDKRKATSSADQGAYTQNSAKKGEEQSESLPQMQIGDVLSASEVSADEHTTQPPARYTEASLVRTLEAKEIGRPSTYASIIATIMDRGYVYEKGRALIPSWLAFSVITLLESYFPQYVDYEFTAQMEHGLDQIAQGHETSVDWLTRFYFGTGADSAKSKEDVALGLHEQVEQLGDIDARAINTIAIGDGLQVRVGRYGPYLEDTKHLDDDGNPKRASIPETLAPDELTVAVGHDLIEHNAGGPRVLGTDPQTGGSVELRTGRFGPYVALITPEVKAAEEAEREAERQAQEEAKRAEAAGEKPKRRTRRKAADMPKPKMASLFRSMTPESLTLDDALRLLSLPRTLGTVEESDDQGNTVVYTVQANNGRYGPYLTKTAVSTDSQSASSAKPETRSLGSEDEIFTVDLAKAKELFAQPKYGRGRGRGAAKPPLRELGLDPDTQKPVTIKDGRFGPYITDGETNRTLPRQFTPESISVEEALRLLAEKRAAGPTTRKRASRSTAKTKSKSTTSTRKKSTSTTKRTTTTKAKAKASAE